MQHIYSRSTFNSQSLHSQATTLWSWFDQMMWMGSGMAPMMFPGVQHYMPRLGMGIGPLAMPSIHSQMHLPRLPLLDQATIPNQAALCHQTTMFNPMNYHAQLQNSKLSEQYANYMAFHPLQNASQVLLHFSLTLACQLKHLDCAMLQCSVSRINRISVTAHMLLFCGIAAVKRFRLRFQHSTAT